MRKTYALWILIFSLAGCIKEFPLKSGGKMPRLPVLHVFLQPDSAVKAVFSYTASITEPLLVINSANILVFKNNVLLDTMQAMGTSNYLLNFGVFNPRDSFKIRVEDAGSTMEIKNAIPSKVQILLADTETALIPGIGPAFSVRIDFPDSAIDDNYYRIYMKYNYYLYTLNTSGVRIDSVLTQEVVSIFGSELPFIQNNFNNYTSKEILFSDQTINGILVKLKFYTTRNIHPTKTTGPLSVELYLENLDKNLYNYYNTRNAHLWQQQSIVQLPGMLEGNIPGGFGAVGGLTFARKIINLK